MTQDEIIRMALEAGFVGYGENGYKKLERFAALVAAHERERQAEQEPDYFGLTHDHTWLSIDKKQYDKLKPEGRMACYAAPIRTKDLTDDEAQKLWNDTSSIVPMWAHHLHFASAVIAADREKNK